MTNAERERFFKGQYADPTNVCVACGTDQHVQQVGEFFYCDFHRPVVEQTA